MLARAHQNLIWTRTRHTNALRSALREYYPAALVAFEDLAHGDALGVLGRAPSPEQGAHLSQTAIQSALKRGGRQRNIADRARQIQTALGSEQLAAPAAVTAAFAASTRATVGVIAELNRQISELEAALAAHFETHPDADIYLSQPGLGVVLGARVLGEFGDDPNRYTDAKSRRNYAGTSPLTVESGKKRAVLARHVRNRRLYDAIDQWAFAALLASPGARAFYDQHRAAGDTHHQALRALGNRLVGILHGCLRHHTPIRRTHRLGTPNPSRRLTTYEPGMSTVMMRLGRRPLVANRRPILALCVPLVIHHGGELRCGAGLLRGNGDCAGYRPEGLDRRLKAL